MARAMHASADGLPASVTVPCATALANAMGFRFSRGKGSLRACSAPAAAARSPANPSSVPPAVSISWRRRPCIAIATGALQETDLVREGAGRRVRDHRGAGAGRDGAGLSGPGPPARARGGHQGAAVLARVRRRVRRAVSAGGPHRGPARASQHHPDLPGRPVRPGHLLRHEVPPGRLALDRAAASARSSPRPRSAGSCWRPASALGYAAQRGIVHRDIKPDNIMFDEFGQCLLTDFGIAKAASGQKLTGTGMSIGTPHYMSPEQARAQAIDGRSDIYSLGVVAYQCLAGTVPYDGEDSFSIGYKHITEPIPTPSLITADERRIFEVIKRMLMKDPADRFQSCEELVASIQGQPTAAPGAVRVSRGGGDGRRPVSAPTVPSPSGGVPPIVSQPTTPHRFAAGQPPRHAARAARPAAPGRRPVARHARRPGLVLGLALAGAGGARRRRRAPSTTTSRAASRRASAGADSRGLRRGHDARPRHDGRARRRRVSTGGAVPAARRPRGAPAPDRDDARAASPRRRRRPAPTRRAPARRRRSVRRQRRHPGRSACRAARP